MTKIQKLTAIKHVEKNVQANLHNIGFGNGFLDMTT